MPLSLVLDEGVSRDAAVVLHRFGHECIHVGEVGKAMATDEEILGIALQENGVVVPLDADFHAILAVSGASSPSVIRIRIEGLRGPEVAECIRLVCGQYEGELMTGCLATVKKRKTTWHMLPIGGSR